MDRRRFLASSGLATLAAGMTGPCLSLAAAREPADYTIRIGTALVEVGPQTFLSMTAYNGQVPGPLLRFKEGRPTVVDIYNDTDTPEQLHWHGQLVPASVDGAAEERTPYRALPLSLAVTHGLRLHGALRDDLTLAPQPLIEEPAAPVEAKAAADRAQDHRRTESDVPPDRPANRAGEEGTESAEYAAHARG